MGKGRAPCCAKVGLNKGSWTPEEDMRLIAHIQKYGHANWRALPKQAGLLRCGKSCRLRWINYLRPDLKRGNFTADEEQTIIKLHGMLGNKWSKIAASLPGRTDNEIKNVWNTHLKKRVAPPCGEQQEELSNTGGTKKKKKKTKENKSGGGGVEAVTIPSPSPASSTTTATTTNWSNGDDSSGEQQSNASKEPDDLLEHLDIPMLDAACFDFDMLVDPVPELSSYYPSVSAPTSPCASSSTSQPPAPAPPRGGVEDDMLELPPESVDIDQELWSIIDADGGVGIVSEPPAAAAPCHVNATGEADATAATTSQQNQEEEGNQWWLENLERELGLWGPMEQDNQYLADPLGVAHPDPLPAMVQDPVNCYFQAGPTTATFPAAGDDGLTSNRM